MKALLNASPDLTLAAAPGAEPPNQVGAITSPEARGATGGVDRTGP